MEKRIITISREFGSGGRTIGKLVAEHLGIQCYDAELIQKLAAESGFDESYVKEAGEYAIRLTLLCRCRGRDDVVLRRNRSCGHRCRTEPEDAGTAFRRNKICRSCNCAARRDNIHRHIVSRR